MQDDDSDAGYALEVVENGATRAAAVDGKNAASGGLAELENASKDVDLGLPLASKLWGSIEANFAHEWCARKEFFK